MRLLLVRHGQTHSNVSGALDTEMPGADLTDLGRAQAAAAGTVLGERPIEAIYCSTLVRTTQTAAPLAERLGLTPIVIEGLREIRAGDLEMRTDEESAHAYRHTVATWLFEDLTARMAGGETGEEFLARFDAAVARIREDGHQLALIVSHGAAIRTWVGARAGGDDAETWRDRALEPMQNTGCIELEYDEQADRWRIVAWENRPVGGAVLEDPDAADPTAQVPD